MATITRVMSELKKDALNVVHDKWTVEFNKEKNVWICITSSKANGYEIENRTFEVKNFKNGTIYFYNGTSSAYAYTRNPKKEKWMQENKIHKIVFHETLENYRFNEHSENSGNGRFYKTIIKTDGNKNFEYDEFFDEYETNHIYNAPTAGNACYYLSHYIKITNATFFIEENEKGFRCLHLKKGINFYELNLVD